jgi:hypothetical protein
MFKLFGFTLSLFLFSIKAEAYPDFISYGYKSCMTCHYSGAGSGQLNDYGRALFASEFTSNLFSNKTPEQLSDESGFLGATELPWWIRPGFKYRGLWFKNRVGSSNSTDRWIHMQLDFDMTFLLDKSQNLIFVSNLSYFPVPARFRNSIETKPSPWISKQHYFRYKLDKEFFIYAGLMDKVFGIRHPDHTAVNRAELGLGIADQSHSVAIQNFNNLYDYTFQYFIGNLNQDADLRQKGFTLSGEYYYGKSDSVGASILSSENSLKSEKRFSITARNGFAKGKSIIFELGHELNSSKTNTIINNRGVYFYSQSLIGLEKGYNLFTTFQYQKPELESSESFEYNQVGLGLLAFPFPKTEFRAEVVNLRVVAPEQTSPDLWRLLTQVHISW